MKTKTLEKKMTSDELYNYLIEHRKYRLLTKEEADTLDTQEIFQINGGNICFGDDNEVTLIPTSQGYINKKNKLIVVLAKNENYKVEIPVSDPEGLYDSLINNDVFKIKIDGQAYEIITMDEYKQRRV